MGTEQRNGNIEAINVAEGPVNQIFQESSPISAHTTDHDSWLQVGFLLVISFNCGYILTYSNLMVAPLGWVWGIICLSVMALYNAYANWLLAGFHIVNGQRFIRYRDIMGHLFGREMFYITWIFQFLTLLLTNSGFILLGGRALKEINSELSDSPIRLQYFIIVTGATYFTFAFFVPTMSAMGRGLGIATALTFIYIVVLGVVVVKDGKSNPNRDYNLHGSKVDKVFNALGSISAMVVCNSCGLLLEVQSTVRRPAVKNMRKALYLLYSVGLIFYYGVSVVGYWAYGSSVSEYLPKELSGPKWVKIVVNAVVLLQSMVSQHMYVAPIHEALDTKFLKLDESMHSRENIKRLFCIRAIFFAGNTLVTAAFPFMGDFVNLFGSLMLVPLTFIFPSMIFIKVKGNKARIEKRVWHWTNIVFSSALGIATTISAIRLIVNNTRQYHFFADT